MKFTDEEKASLRALFGKNKNPGSTGSVAVQERTPAASVPRKAADGGKTLVIIDVEDPIIADAFFLGLGENLE